VLHVRTYEVMDSGRQHLLCRIKESKLNLEPRALTGAIEGNATGHGSEPARTTGYIVENPEAKVAIWAVKFLKRGDRGFLIHVVDSQTNRRLGLIDVNAPRWKGVIEATWTTIDGQPLMHATVKQPITGPDGREVCIERHPALALRDIWELEFKPGLDRLYILIFAVIWACEKLPRGSL